MPPAMLEYRGIDVARQFFAAVTLRPGRSYRVVPTRANGQPAFGKYMADPHTGSTGPTDCMSSRSPTTASARSPASARA